MMYQKTDLLVIYKNPTRMREKIPREVSLKYLGS